MHQLNVNNKAKYLFYIVLSKTNAPSKRSNDKYPTYQPNQFLEHSKFNKFAKSGFIPKNGIEEIVYSPVNPLFPPVSHTATKKGNYFSQ